MTNEAFSRVKIDAQLRDQGWEIENPNAVRFEYMLGDGTRADYVLCNRHGHSLGVIEAKKAAINPAEAESQAHAYAAQLKVPYIFLTNGSEVRFWEWEVEAFPRTVKTFYSQGDLERRSAIFFMGWVPLVFGHYLAKSMAINEKKEKEAIRHREAEEAIKIRKNERVAAEKQGKLGRDRTHFIKKFASINNYLDHFSSQEYLDKKSYIRQEIIKELAELVAGRTLSDLKEVISSNEDVQLSLHDLSANLKRHSIENVNVTIMLGMICDAQS